MNQQRFIPGLTLLARTSWDPQKTWRHEHLKTRADKFAPSNFPLATVAMLSSITP
jgi:hypothetical protein